MTWKSELQAEIELRHRVDAEFTLQQIYTDIAPVLAARHPANMTVDETIRRELQKLRDENFIAFVNDDGLYRRIG